MLFTKTLDAKQNPQSEELAIHDHTSLHASRLTMLVFKKNRFRCGVIRSFSFDPCALLLLLHTASPHKPFATTLYYVYWMFQHMLIFGKWFLAAALCWGRDARKSALQNQILWFQISICSGRRFVLHQHPCTKIIF